MRKAVHKYPAASSADNRRVYDRESVIAPSTVRASFAPAPIEVETRDFSSSGCQFVSSKRLPAGSRISLGLAGAGSASATVVRAEGDVHACMFDRPLSPGELRKAFRGTTIVELAGSHFEAPRDERWLRPTRGRAILALGALGWLLPVGLFLIA